MSKHTHDQLVKINALVAEYIMGLENVNMNETVRESGLREGRLTHRVVGEGDCYVPDYSTDISAAWEIVSNFIAQGYMLSIYSPDHPKDSWYVQVDEATTDGEGLFHCTGKAEASTASEAICIAALKAKGFYND